MSGLPRNRRLWILCATLLVGIGGILYGYDIGVISGALLFIHKVIPMTNTQTGVVVGAVLGGGLVGTLVAGPLADYLGRRFIIATASIVFIVGVGLILLAHSFITFLLARFFLGVGVGIVAVAVPLYVTELVPSRDRGKYVTFFQLFLTFGIVLAYCVDLIFSHSGNWRAMFAIVIVPALVMLIGIFKLPESPRWLISRGRKEEGRRVLLYTHSKQEADTEFILIQNSFFQEQGSWRELFSSKQKKQLMIAVLIAVLTQWTGINSFLQYAPSILKSTGMATDTMSMLGSLGIGVINFVCTVLALLMVDRIGRKPLLIVGVAGILISEIFLGIVTYMNMPGHLEGMLALFGLFFYITFYAIGPGVVVWLAMSELFPTKNRGKGLALCLFFNSMAGWSLASFFFVLQNWLGMYGTFWLCAGFSFLYLLVAIFLLPETKAKSLEDIQNFFHKDKKKDAYGENVYDY